MNIKGFTLVEVLAGLIIAGILSAILASVINQGIQTSQALLEERDSSIHKAALRRIIHRDIKNMEVRTSIKPETSGFSLITSHNILTSNPLPVTVNWNFSNGKIVRSEENEELLYSAEQIIHQDLNSYELDFFCMTQDRWISLDNWLLIAERGEPVGLRLRIQFKDQKPFAIIENARKIQ